jgi:hypothetical protein
MRLRFLAAFLAVCLLAMGQTMSVAKLALFLKDTQTSKEFKYTDQEIAKFLRGVKLTDKLDDRTIEDIQSEVKLGPKTLAALRVLRDESAKENLKPGPGLAIVVAPPPKPIPPPSSEEQAAVLDDVRQYALGYSANLPDFICTEVTNRYAAPAPGTRYGGPVTDTPHWQKMDQLTVRLSYFEQKEDYKLILHNSSPTSQDLKTVGGSQSFGDFGSMLREIFEPTTEARFEWDHWGTLRGQRVMAFHYSVSRELSQYHLIVDNDRGIITAYNGLVEVDPNTHVVLRVTVEAQDIPSDFPVKRAKDVLDYDYTEISGHTFLLPMKAQVEASMGDYVTRNDKEFKIYRKYSAESEINYGDVDAPPIPDEKTKETVEPNQAPPPPPATKKGGGSQ